MRESTQKQIRIHAERMFPRECCGVIIVQKGKDTYIPCANVGGRDDNFAISPASYAMASDMGTIIAIVHSHPNAVARPSDADKVSCEATNLPWHIVHVSIPDGAKDCVPVATEIHTFEPVGFEAPLVGRPFSHGVLDCYTLVRDKFKRDFGIILPDFEREDDWWYAGQNLYLDNFAKAGFEAVEGPLQVGDGILMQIRSPVANHAAVYLGRGIILQHLAGRMSSRDVYDGYFQECTRMIVRHKDMKT